MIGDGLLGKRFIVADTKGTKCGLTLRRLYNFTGNESVFSNSEGIGCLGKEVETHFSSEPFLANTFNTASFWRGGFGYSALDDLSLHTLS